MHIVRFVANAFGEISAAEFLREAAKTSNEAYQVAIGYRHYGPAFDAAAAGEKQTLSHSARCIFGNPFRPVTLEPSWLTSTVLTLAEGIYAERAFDRVPVLADALQDAGCENPDVLDHCRSETVHTRGCWALDLLLGKS